MNKPFEEIYSNNEWGHGSGEGSLPKHTQGYAAFLQRFLTDRSITSIVDAGCGDWQFSSGIDWGAIQYAGYDVVPDVIRRNQEAYARKNVSFHLYSGNPDELPDADLLIVKDVLQHLSNSAVFYFISILKRYKYALLTSCVDPGGGTDNVDIADGGFRYLDLRRPPFNLSATEIYSFTNRMNPIRRWLRGPRWLKSVLLVCESSGPQGPDE